MIRGILSIATILIYSASSYGVPVPIIFEAKASTSTIYGEGSSFDVDITVFNNHNDHYSGRGGLFLHFDPEVIRILSISSELKSGPGLYWIDNVKGQAHLARPIFNQIFVEQFEKVTWATIEFESISEGSSELRLELLSWSFSSHTRYIHRARPEAISSQVSVSHVSEPSLSYTYIILFGIVSAFISKRRKQMNQIYRAPIAVYSANNSK